MSVKGIVDSYIILCEDKYSSNGEFLELRVTDMVKEDVVRLVLSVEEARRLLGLSRGLMYQAIRTGQVPSVRIGRRILIPRRALEQMLDKADTHKT